MPRRPISSDLVLLLLRAPDGAGENKFEIRGITRLEKLLFLADRETGIRDQVDEPFDFRPYNYGPYSKQIYQAVELLEELDLVEEDREFQESALDEMEEISAALDEQEGIERRFMLTPRGRAVADLLASRHPHLAQTLAEIKSRYGGLSLKRLIRDVYSRYPDMAVNSIIRDTVF